jgi:hypothetical protein
MLKKIKKIFRKVKVFLANNSPKLVTSDFSSFEKEMKIWCNSLILRWHLTDRCNYLCPYCSQNHKGLSAFDIHKPHEWVEAIADNFNKSKIAVTISGGEPMIDSKNMFTFLDNFLIESFVDNVRIDTNLFWNPKYYAKLPHKEKLIFMVTLHPSQTKISDFINRLKKLISYEFKVGIINYVMYGEQINQYSSIEKSFSKLGLPLHPNPLWNSIPSEALMRLMSKSLPNVDLQYRTGLRTKGKSCIYPMFAYRMDQYGKLSVGCFPHLKGDLFKKKLPKRPPAPIACPMESCVCLDKYSFIKGISRNIGLNILEIYGDIVRQKLGI